MKKQNLDTAREFDVRIKLNLTIDEIANGTEKEIGCLTNFVAGKKKTKIGHGKHQSNIRKTA